MLIKNISVALIASNAEKTLSLCLDSLKDFEEVIIYENNSIDNTKQIASSYPNVKLFSGEFLGFGPSKNLAVSYATNDWVLSLDTDEVLSPEFIKALSDITLDENSVYTILRTNYYKQSQIKHCWGNDIIIRLFNKNKTKFTDKKVHEKIISDNLHVLSIQGMVKHYPYTTISDFIVKLDKYSTIYAQDNVGKKSSSPLKAFLNGNFSFFKTYILKRGFLDGYAGLIIAFSHMATNFYKYIKLYELNKELKRD
ncbi:glycosyltransferase family 2 protein [Sulfurimonas sp. C5]|uniref:glycosyltransferase family 2 protein n=1 Tax=Sulfurimonas sp. C5 TaxID=3036947 RepID=UPI002458087C|nr:glycosyltransferase family 2 protein [Sulfurimonas sp. C5]MDH4945455.1 glycosyltransferase family 2 protein [Sulfurimonas sp. C5]